MAHLRKHLSRSRPPLLPRQDFPLLPPLAFSALSLSPAMCVCRAAAIAEEAGWGASVAAGGMSALG